MDGGGSMTLSAKAQKLLARQRKIARFPYLVKIEHDEDPQFPLYFANADEDITFQGKIYNAASFSIDPPGRDGDKIGDAALTISAIDQFWIRKIRSARKPARLVFMAVISYDGQNGIEGIEPVEEIGFTLRAARFNEMSVTWTMVFDERMAVIVPSDSCDAMNAPGCS
jgi:hypothetical protein